MNESVHRNVSLAFGVCWNKMCVGCFTVAGTTPPRFLAARLLHGVRHIYVTATVFAS